METRLASILLWSEIPTLPFDADQGFWRDSIERRGDRTARVSGIG